jgi:aminoglycoside N3'-acetyltransferase
MSPLHSHAVMGTRAAAVLAADWRTSFGPGSSFAAMEAAGFHLLLLGCTLHEGGTFVHHVEATEGVPYRDWIDLSRQVVLEKSGPADTVSVRYYARKPELNFANDLHGAEMAALNAYGTRRVAIGNRHSLLVPLTSLHRSIAGLLNDDPYALVRPAMADAGT